MAGSTKSRLPRIGTSIEQEIGNDNNSRYDDSEIDSNDGGEYMDYESDREFPHEEIPIAEVKPMLYQGGEVEDWDSVFHDRSPEHQGVDTNELGLGSEHGMATVMAMGAGMDEDESIMVMDVGMDEDENIMATGVGMNKDIIAMGVDMEEDEDIGATKSDGEGSESSLDLDVDPVDEIYSYQPENPDTGDELELPDDMDSDPSPAPSDDQLEGPENKSRALISKYEDFPYSSVPHVKLERNILRQIHLLQLRMDGNVADLTHNRYVTAFNNFYKEDSDGIEVGVSSEAKARKALAETSNLYHVRYDVCRNGCICYAAFPSAQVCHMCGESWLDATGTAFRTLDYIPLIYRLRLLYTDPIYVQKTVEYKNSESFQKAAISDQPPTTIHDYWDGLLCSVLWKQRGLWQDPRDVGFIFSTDGFPLFKVGVFDIWPLLLINANLPPSERVFKRNMMLSGIIPGPENPKDIGPFLTPLIDELVILQGGVKAWDGLRKGEFMLRAHICLVAGDTMAMAKLMKWTGKNGTNLYLALKLMLF